MGNRIILLINAIIEITGGLILILYPEFLIGGEVMDNLELNISKMYGIAATFIGLFSYLMYRFSESSLLIKYTALSIIVFHLIISLHLYGMLQADILKGPHSMITHLVITIVFGIIYLKNLK